MNYQTEIDFALRILQDAEDRSFSEEKMQVLVQQDADYMRVFLPQPHTLARLCLLAHNALYGLDRTIAIEANILKNEKRYEALTQELERLSNSKTWFFNKKKKKQAIADLEARISDLRMEIAQCMEEVQSPSAAPWERDRMELCHILTHLLCPPILDNTEGFEQTLCNEIHRFYGQKGKYFESLYD
jgi:hypothetical protein